MKRSSAGLAVLLAFVLVGCGDSPHGSPLDPTTAANDALPPGTLAFEGSTGPGAVYGVYRPAAWNGALILYAHGYIAPGTPTVLPTADPSIAFLRDALLSLGYGVAMSSFSETGFALKDGAQRTQQLAGLFASRFQKPSRTLLVGHSLGGAIALYLAEKHPNHYAGAMPICSFVGGSTLQAEYIANVRAVFDVLFPGVIPGGVFDVPADLDFDTEVAPAVAAAVGANPAGAVAFAAVDQVGIVYTSAAELLAATLGALRYQMVGTNDLLARTHGRIPIDNTETVYTIGGVPQPLLNAAVERFSSTPDARNYLENYFEPEGDLRIPVLTLHNTADPIMPAWHEAVLAGTVAAQGTSDMLLQRLVDRFGHCNITPAEHVAALVALETWIATGVKPAG